MFLDHVLCRDATLFVGNSQSKTSKQIVSLREAVDKPSFILKSDMASSSSGNSGGGGGGVLGGGAGGGGTPSD